MHDWGDMLVQAGSAEPVMDMERITLTFAEPQRLLQELREPGAKPAPGRALACLRGCVGAPPGGGTARTGARGWRDRARSRIITVRLQPAHQAGNAGPGGQMRSGAEEMRSSFAWRANPPLSQVLSRGASALG